METDPFRNLGDPARIGAITGIVTVIITALALPDTTRTYGISIVIIVAILYPCYFILLRIISIPRNTIPLHENRLSNNLGASRRPNLYQQASTYSQNRVAIIHILELYSPAIIFFVSDITLGVIISLFPKQTLNETSTWQSEVSGIALITMIFSVVYYSINLLNILGSNRRYSGYKLNSALYLFFSILAILSAIIYAIISYGSPNIVSIAQKLSLKETYSHIDSKTSIVLGLWFSSALSAMGSIIAGILFLFIYNIKKLLMKLRN